MAIAAKIRTAFEIVQKLEARITLRRRVAGVGLVLPYEVDTQDWAFSLSKALQILIPLGLFVALRELPGRRFLFELLARGLYPKANEQTRTLRTEEYERRFERLLGFLAWKIGCDLGFFIVMGDSWLRAITPAGLIPYTIAQYLVYRIFGQKMLLGGMINPFQRETYQLPKLKRRRPIQRVLAKFLHEDMNATSIHVPTRRVALKPVADYLAVIVAWSLYTMGIFWVQSGELNTQPLQYFPHATMIGMYLGGVLSYIIGFNIGQAAMRGLGDQVERFLEQRRIDHHRSPTSAPIWPRSLRWRLVPIVDRYGFGVQWFGSVLSGILMVAVFTPIFFDAVQEAAYWLDVKALAPDAVYSTRAAEQVAGQQQAPDTRPDFDNQFNQFIEARKDLQP